MPKRIKKINGNGHSACRDRRQNPCRHPEKPRRLIGLPESLLVGKLLSQVVWNMETQKPVVEQVHLGNWNNVFPTYTC